MPRVYRHCTDLVRVLESTRGVLERPTILARHGAHALRASVTDGSVVRILPGLYAHASTAGDPRTRVLAASMWASPQGAVTSEGALWVWGAMGRAPDHFSVHMPVATRRTCPLWLRVVRTDVAPATLTVRGVRVVDVAHATVRAWCELRGERAVAVVVETIGRRLASARDVARAAGEVPRVRARLELAALLGLLDGGVTSYLEFRARAEVFPLRMFPELEWQVPVRARGRRRVLDAYAPASRLALEFDGAAFHAKDTQRRADIERDAELATEGILVLRFTYEDITGRPDWCRAVYQTARAARARETDASVARCDWTPVGKA